MKDKIEKDNIDNVTCNVSDACCARSKLGIAVMLAGLLVLLLGLAALQPAYADNTVQLQFTLLNQNPDPVAPGNYVELRFSIENVGFGSADNLRVELLPAYPFSLDPGVSAISDLGAISSRNYGDNKLQLFYRLRVDDNAVEGDTDLQMRYSVDGGKNWATLEKFQIRIRSTDSILTMDSVKTVPAEVGPGEPVSISMTLRNSANTLLKDIKVDLQLYGTTTSGTITELPLTPVGGGVEKTIDKLAPGESADVKFDLIVGTDATSKPYKVPVTITYKNSFGENYSKSNVLGVVVYKKPDYVLTLEDTDIHTDKQKGSVVLSFSNTGVSDIKFLSIELAPSEDYTILSASKVYIGNLQSDDFDTAKFDIFVDSAKQSVPLVVNLNFKDSYNQDQTQTVVLPGIKMFSQTDATKYGLVAQKQSSIIWIVIVVVVVGVLLFIFLRRRKPRRTG